MDIDIILPTYNEILKEYLNFYVYYMHCEVNTGIHKTEYQDNFIMHRASTDPNQTIPSTEMGK